MASVKTLGLGKTMENKLHSVGIHSAEELTDMGSKKPFSCSKKSTPIPALSYCII